LVKVLTLVSITASLKLLKLKIHKKFVQGLLKNKILKLAPKHIIEVLKVDTFMTDAFFKS